MNAYVLRRAYFGATALSWISSFLPIKVSLMLFTARTDIKDVSFLTGESWVGRNCSQYLSTSTENHTVFQYNRGTKEIHESIQDISGMSAQEDCLEDIVMSKSDQIFLVVLLVIGALMILSSMIGLCAALHKSKDLLVLNIVIAGLGFVVLLGITFGVLYGVYSKVNTIQLVQDSVNRLSSFYSQQPNEGNSLQKPYTEMLDAFQSENHCCGIQGPQNLRQPNISLNYQDPLCSCCKYDQGCWFFIYEQKKKMTWIVFSLLFSCSIVLGCVSFIGILLSQYLPDSPI